MDYSDDPIELTGFNLSWSCRLTNLGKCTNIKNEVLTFNDSV